MMKVSPVGSLISAVEHDPKNVLRCDALEIPLDVWMGGLGSKTCEVFVVLEECLTLLRAERREHIAWNALWRRVIHQLYSTRDLHVARERCLTGLKQRRQSIT